jgi:hypothetical protein
MKKTRSILSINFQESLAIIEIVSSNNLDEILPLIKSYQEFYNAVPTSYAHNKHFFSQFNKESSAGCQFLYRKKIM